MKVKQQQWTTESGWINAEKSEINQKAQLVLVFGGTEIIKKPETFSGIREQFPDSHIIICSTAGEIHGKSVRENSISLTALYFEKTEIKINVARISHAEKSLEVGAGLADSLPKENLAHILVFAEGLKINGSNFVDGLKSTLPENVAISGGLVGDGSRFQQTLIGFNGVPEEGMIIAIGLYGKKLKIGLGSFGGWDTFGPNRLITKSKDNILYEIDNKPVLNLYKEYLGELSSGLPGTGLLFPLCLKIMTVNGEIDIVRTILAVDEKEQSMTFAGNLPEGNYAMLMKANLERLIDGAGQAAVECQKQLDPRQAVFALLVSCVGRRLILKERTEEEVEAVASVLGEQAFLSGFYSYGEISPAKPIDNHGSLHNQTMAITAFLEIE